MSSTGESSGIGIRQNWQSFKGNGVQKELCKGGGEVFPSRDVGRKVSF